MGLGLKQPWYLWHGLGRIQPPHPSLPNTQISVALQGFVHSYEQFGNKFLTGPSTPEDPITLTLKKSQSPAPRFSLEGERKHEGWPERLSTLQLASCLKGGTKA